LLPPGQHPLASSLRGLRRDKKSERGSEVMMKRASSVEEVVMEEKLEEATVGLEPLADVSQTHPHRQVALL
jgi:hypothetical protein